VTDDEATDEADDAAAAGRADDPHSDATASTAVSDTARYGGREPERRGLSRMIIY
jgi:hypothetical protein